MAAPVFNTTAYNVDENVFGTGSTTVQVDVSDADLDTLVYSISGSAADNGKFTIDPVTGILTFNVSPDFENPADAGANGTYDVEISVFDGTTTVTQVITIAVADVLPAVIDGTSGDDILDNDDGTTVEGDTLNGLAGNDTLDGGLGADTMVGGDGNDIYIVDNIGDTADETGTDGTDEVRSSVSFTIAAGIENLVLTGSDGIDGTGNSGDNTITGNSGDNVLDGGLGSDTMTGNDGSDTYMVNLLGDVVDETGEFGSDTVISSIDFTIGSSIENLTLAGSAINGTGNGSNNDITGNAEDNELTGLGGRDDLDGRGGADHMIGGSGNDTYVVDNAGDDVDEGGGSGTDKVFSSIDYTLEGDIENLTLTGTAINGTGNSLDNVLAGNAEANVLSGLGGADTLNGGVGDDHMIGGDGNDTYVVDSLLDITDETGTTGTDTVQTAINYTLNAVIENLTLTGSNAGTGNALDNTITGSSLANTLNGGNGIDTLAGGDGDDTYVVDSTTDIITEGSGGSSGSDLITTSVTLSTLAANVERLTLLGTAALNATGNGLDNIITGNSAANLIDGGTGADSMIGGNGADTYTVDNVGDTITEGTGVSSGVDIVNSSVSYTLSGNVEKLNLLGTASSGTGNATGNTITGNSSINMLSGMDGSDTLDGGTGADVLIGGTGSDTYIVDNTGDTITEGTDVGLDTAKSSVTYTLSGNVENLTLTGAAAIDGTGNGGRNTLMGNGAINTLTGGNGIDNLTGGLGADILIGGNGNDTYNIDATDTITEASGSTAGVDLVRAGFTYSIAALANLENIELTGVGNFNATGNAGNNILTGNTGTNVLTGGGGDDTFVINKTTDSVVELSGEGNDTVIATGIAGTTFTMANFVETMNLGGIVATNATGNDLDNAINGNAVANTLNGGNGNDVLFGDAGNDTLTGGEGDDTLDGGFGVDTMTGGNGGDTYNINEATDSVVEGSGGTTGTDTIVSTLANYTLIANVENLTMGGANAINGTGNSVANVITGNKGINALNGAGGADTINGGGGADNINGGADADTLNGGNGIDRFLFSTAAEANGDSITNVTDGEIFNLSAIDWDTVTAGDQSFTVDADDVFVAGEMDLVVSGSTVTVNLYTDNVAGADSSFTITVALGTEATELTFIL